MKLCRSLFERWFGRNDTKVLASMAPPVPELRLRSYSVPGGLEYVDANARSFASE